MSAVAELLAAVEIGQPLERGTLALFPLFHERPPARRYITGPCAFAHCEIQELADGPTVPTLEFLNESDWPILLLDGETLTGARQNRIVTVSVLMPPRQRSQVAVTCVEAGRWGADRPVLRSGRHAPGGVRARNRASVHASVVDGGRVQPDQVGVWEEVDRYAHRFAATAPTRAMEDVHDAAAAHVGALVAGTRPLDGQCGVAAAIGETVVAIDLFDAPQTLADYWDALVAGYALDADASRCSHPRRRAVRSFLGSLAAGRATVADDRVHVAGEGVTATALLLENTIVHLAASGRDSASPRRWFG